MKKYTKRTLICIVILLILWVVYSLVSHRIYTPKREYTNTIKILTYNTHGTMIDKKIADKKTMLQYINQQGADIICLQEVLVYKDPKLLTLPALRDAMKEYPYTYYDFKQYNTKRQFGNVVFSRYPLINKRTIRYNSKSNISSQCDIVIGNDTLNLIINHLESYGLVRQDLQMDSLSVEGITKSCFGQKLRSANKLRREQAKIIKLAVKESPYPVIVVGDFNAIPLSYVYWKIKFGLRDCFLETSLGHLGTTYIRKGVGVRIDYILCSRKLHPIECEVDKQANFSDHFPLSATIGL